MPTTASRPDLHDRLHVQLVEIGTLLTIHLDADEVFVEQLRDRFVLETLSLHDVAPMTGGVADREKDRFVLLPGQIQSLLAPRPPVHWVMSMLQEIRTGLVGEAIRHGLVPVGGMKTEAESNEGKERRAGGPGVGSALRPMSAPPCGRCRLLPAANLTKPTST